MKKLSSILLLISLTAAAAGEAYRGGTPHGEVVELTSDTFSEAIHDDPANSLWLLKFYAPWCGHCKTLAPVLRSIAPQIKGKMAIGTIDCTKQKDLCNEYGVRGYPTLKFARDGQIHEYPGNRKAESLVEFAIKMSSNPVQVVSTYDEAIQKVAAKSIDGVAFVAYHPQVKGSNTDDMLLSTPLTQIFGNVARQQQAIANFALLSPKAAKDETLKFAAVPKKGFVVKVEENVEPKVFNVSKETTVAEFNDFVARENFALVANIGPKNFNRLGRNGKPLVMGVVDGSNVQQVSAMKKDLASFATTGPKELVDKYYFGWMDGSEWARFMEQFNVTELPQIIALDVPTKTYWQDLAYKTTSDFVQAVQDGKIESEKAEGQVRKGVLGMIQRMIADNIPYSIMFLAALCISIAMCLIPDPNDLRPPYKHQQPQAKAKKQDAKTIESKKQDAKTTESKKQK